MYHLITFSDFVEEPLTRYYMGYSLIGLLAFAVIFNLGIIFTQAILSSLRKYKLL